MRPDLPDLCLLSNPLILSTPSHNPSTPRSAPSVQVPAASDLPLQVAFVQLWPRLLLGRAALPQPLRCQDGPLLRSPWQPWLLTPHLLTYDLRPQRLTARMSIQGQCFCFCYLFSFFLFGLFCFLDVGRVGGASVLRQNPLAERKTEGGQLIWDGS